MKLISDALAFANEHHRDQKKPGTETPYIYHPMAVASLVLQYGGTEAHAAAALLHDTIADGKVSQAELSERFGAEVARLAYAFADPAPAPAVTPAWRSQKEAYLEKLASLDESALLVVACEELHEARELLHDLRYQGVSVWKRFPVPAIEIGWYFREILRVIHPRLKGPRARPLVSELATTVKGIMNITFEAGSPPGMA